MIQERWPYEITHPPLGKAIISLGIRLFGMTPFGWRFMGALTGVLMVPLMYLLVKQLTKDTRL
ncbi:MAG: glycosyltransferase family 39 protein, partial [Oscillospiraceae bacterium]|nr:glycosyltransferase family 39 protein [Oscillospiraceae bacterium]